MASRCFFFASEVLWPAERPVGKFQLSGWASAMGEIKVDLAWTASTEVHGQQYMARINWFCILESTFVGSTGLFYVPDPRPVSRTRPGTSSTCVCVCVCVCVCARVRVCVCVLIHVSMHAYTYVFVYVWQNVCVHMRYLCMYDRMCICVCMTQCVRAYADIHLERRHYECSSVDSWEQGLQVLIQRITQVLVQPYKGNLHKFQGPGQVFCWAGQMFGPDQYLFIYPIWTGPEKKTSDLRKSTRNSQFTQSLHDTEQWNITAPFGQEDLALDGCV
jgi:hypothetical protein